MKSSLVRKLSEQNGSKRDPEEEVSGQSLIQMFVVTHQVPLQRDGRVKSLL